MTYKLEPGLSRISSPIVLVMPDGEKRDLFANAACLNKRRNEKPHDKYCHVSLPPYVLCSSNHNR